MKPLHNLVMILRFLVLILVFTITFIGGSLFIEGMVPDTEPEPAFVPGVAGLLIIAAVNTFVASLLVLTSRWRGWKLAGLLALSWYGVNTFLTQVETWYFLSDITVGSGLLRGLFLMGIPVALIFIPSSVLILGKWRDGEQAGPAPVCRMPLAGWVWRLAVIAVIYVILYWTAGYFIAWQNPELRAFYGSEGEIAPLWQHTAGTFGDEPGLLLMQLARGIVWALLALPVILGSCLNKWATAVVVGLFFSLPSNIVHILENPLMPLASVRFSHMVETISSTFIFGIMVTLLLYCRLRQT